MTEEQPENLASESDAHLEESLVPVPEPVAAGASGSWMQHWQMPALLLGLAMVISGLYLAMPTSEPEDFDGALDSVQAFIRAQNLEKAQQKLKKDASFLQAEQTPRRIKARYWMLWGDLVFQQIQTQSLGKAEDYQKVVTYYRKSRDYGQVFDGEHLRRWASTLVKMDRLEEALAKIDQVPLKDRSLKWKLVKQIIVFQVRKHQDTPARLVPWLSRFFEQVRYETDPVERRKAMIWGVTLHARLLLDANDPNKVIDYLQLKYIRFRDEGGDSDLAPVEVRLAQAYQQAGNYVKAGYWLDLAQKKLNPEDVLNAQILVAKARIQLADTGELRKALEFFSTAVMRYHDAPQFLEALIGQADCEARLGIHVQALKHLREASAALLKALNPRAQRKKQFVQVARSNYELAFSQDKFDLALSYLSALKPVFGDKLPARVLADFALVHEKIALLRQAEADKLARTVPIDEIAAGENLKAMKLANQEAALGFGKSADYFYRHALAVTIADDQAHGDSLWRAGENYDRAQQWEQAIQMYSEFVRVRASDPRLPSAIRHLGMAYQADGQYKVAHKLFKELVERHPKSEAAYHSLVPMAQCLVALGEYDQARRILRHVLKTHDAITPQSKPYRQALIELGQLDYTQGKYLQAITHLEEAIDPKRYSQSPQGPMLRYRLAQAYRQSIGQLDKTLADPIPQSRRVVLQKQRVANLKRAGVLYSQAINAFEARAYASLSKLEKTAYRNAYFYRADCEYDQRHWEQAIALYDLAAKRWENEPASLVALVQIVNAYCEQGAIQEAKAANDRARYQLKRIPDEAFDDPSLPMDRQHWEDWLRWTTELDLFASRKP